MKIHFIGIAGSGMLPLALYLARHGHTVTGSDRFLDQQVDSPKFQLLRDHDIALFAQDGSGLTPETSQVIYSAAVEDTVPDLAQARSRGIEALVRPEALARILNDARGIAVAGSSGKSTTAGMIGFILEEAGRQPSLINGAGILNYAECAGGGAFLTGTSDLLCIEADESDGSVVNYRPEVGIVLNVSRDHHEPDQVRCMFAEFASHSQTVIYNIDCPHLEKAGLADLKRALAFSPGGTVADFTVTEAADRGTGVDFRLNGTPFSLGIPGLYNIENAVAAAAAAEVLDISLKETAAILREFRGMERRMNIIGMAADITVLDDFAHNPAKIRAALRTARKFGSRIIALYQPHGFGPTAFIRDELLGVFAEELTSEDHLLIAEIFYAGGTTERNISSAELAAAARQDGIKARALARKEACTAAADAAMPGDVIIIMGARDITLGQLARDILGKLRERLEG